MIWGARGAAKCSGAQLYCHDSAGAPADTIRSKISNVALFTPRPDLLMYGFLAVMIAAAFWDNLSALPTHPFRQDVRRGRVA